MNSTEHREAKAEVLQRGKEYLQDLDKFSQVLSSRGRMRDDESRAVQRGKQRPEWSEEKKVIVWAEDGAGGQSMAIENISVMGVK